MTTFDPEDIPLADGYSRDDFGTPDEVRGWNLCREYVIGMVRGDDPREDVPRCGAPVRAEDGCVPATARCTLISGHGGTMHRSARWTWPSMTAEAAGYELPDFHPETGHLHTCNGRGPCGCAGALYGLAEDAAAQVGVALGWLDKHFMGGAEHHCIDHQGCRACEASRLARAVRDWPCGSTAGGAS